VLLSDEAVWAVVQLLFHTHETRLLPLFHSCAEIAFNASILLSNGCDAGIAFRIFEGLHFGLSKQVLVFPHWGIWLYLYMQNGLHLSMNGIKWRVHYYRALNCNKMNK
jgi:hypothetical protein